MKQFELTTENVLTYLPAPLLAWYRENARCLPWRNTDDPYRIWISEIMLQQTRVAAVMGYYARFLEAFPSVEVLAAASEEQLMKMWEGLGYYSRARNLQKAAKIIAEQGYFPDTYEALMALPGIGDYTASAIASAAFGRREAAIDGNVMRVITRVTDCHSDSSNPKIRQKIREELQSVMPKTAENIRVFNQAAMEVGALVCVPNGLPKCEICPAREFCLGRLRGTAETLPVKAPKKERKIETRTVFLLLRDGCVAIRKRPATGLLAGLWEFPNVTGELPEGAAGAAVNAWDLSAKEWKNRLSAKHIFTHIEWHMTGYTVEVSGQGPSDFIWLDQEKLKLHAVPSAFSRYYMEAVKELEKFYKAT